MSEINVLILGLLESWFFLYRQSLMRQSTVRCELPLNAAQQATRIKMDDCEKLGNRLMANQGETYRFPQVGTPGAC
jgi:hypothetical protein